MRLICTIAALLAANACARDGQKEPPSADPPAKHELVTRTPDAAAGRDLFVVKGCVMCHAVNGVGGKAAPALDADTEMDAIDPV
jgi:cytochrome c